MYECKKCGNRKHFIERNCVETEVTLDENTGKITGTRDTFIFCSEVKCGVCKATSANGEIVGRSTGKLLKVD